MNKKREQFKRMLTLAHPPGYRTEPKRVPPLLIEHPETENPSINDILDLYDVDTLDEMIDILEKGE